MFESLPASFKEYGLPADVRTLLLLRKSMERGLVNTLGDIYVVLRGIVVKDPQMQGPYTQAFYDYFLTIPIGTGETLDAAVERSATFQDWKENYVKEHPEWAEKDMSDLIDRFLSEVHVTSYDIQNIISGKDILAKDDPSLKDNGSGPASENNELNQAADYQDVDMDELLRRMEEVAKQQKEGHSGGSHWIGTGGISPYGHGGAAAGGIRVGGSGGGKMARKVIDDSRYFPVDLDERLRDDNIDAALASLKGVLEESAQKYLDINQTIEDGLKQGGLFLPVEEDIITEKMQILLLIDNGGYSMDPFIWAVMELFKKMKTRFAHDLEVYYFHNTIYGHLYSDERRRKPVSIESFLTKDPNYRVFVVGDAAMAPYELHEESIKVWMSIAEKFKKSCWLNPVRKRSWNFTPTIKFLGEILPMYELTPRGIENAVRDMNRKFTAQ